MKKLRYSHNTMGSADFDVGGDEEIGKGYERAMREGPMEPRATVEIDNTDMLVVIVINDEPVAIVPSRGSFYDLANELALRSSGVTLWQLPVSSV